MIKTNNIHKYFSDLHVLKGIDIAIDQGEIVSIVGASGAGKSTFLQILGTLDKPDQGKILFNDLNVTEFSKKELAKFRNQNIGFVFQFHNLLTEFTALENVCLPAFLAGVSRKQAESTGIDFYRLSQIYIDFQKSVTDFQTRS